MPKGVHVKTWEQRVTNFWALVAKAGEDDCWLWLGAKDKDGYGLFGTATRSAYRASRFSLELSLGRRLICKEMALHNCPNGDNPSCVNPKHLWVGTSRDNNRDTVAKGKHVCSLVPRSGEQHPGSKLTDVKVKKIRELYATGDYSQSQLAEMFGVQQPAIKDVVNYITWRHVG